MWFPHFAVLYSNEVTFCNFVSHFSTFFMKMNRWIKVVWYLAKMLFNQHKKLDTFFFKIGLLSQIPVNCIQNFQQWTQTSVCQQQIAIELFRSFHRTMYALVCQKQVLFWMLRNKKKPNRLSGDFSLIQTSSCKWNKRRI